MITPTRSRIICLLYILIAVCCHASSLVAQDDLRQNRVQQLQSMQEKLHLTLDRPYYEAGDTIWFRGTLLRADNLSYLVKSNYITVELINEEGSVVIRRKVLREGLCFHHCLPLSDQLRTGYYTLRAYTSWMRNYPERLMAYRTLTILNDQLPLPEGWQVRHHDTLPLLADMREMDPAKKSVADRSGTQPGDAVANPVRQSRAAGTIALTDGDLSRPRDLITLDVHIFDPATGQPLRGDFAISVLDARQIDCQYDQDASTDITRSLPFGQRLAEGEWQALADSIGEAFPHPLEQREWLSGRVEHLVRRDVKDPTRVAISVVDSHGHSWGTSRLDSLGRFFIPDLNYPDQADLEVRSLTRGDYPLYVFDPPTFPVPRHYYPASLFDLESQTSAPREAEEDALFVLLQGLHTRLLAGVEVRGRRHGTSDALTVVGDRLQLSKSYVDANYDTYQYEMADELLPWVAEQDFSGFFAGHGRSDSMEYVVQVIDGEGRSHSKWNTDMEWYLSRLYVSDIDRIEAVRGVNMTGVYDETGFGNYINVYLHEGAEVSDRRRDQRRVHHRTFGYTPAQYFYLPRYLTPEQKASPEPDMRRTLAWEPSFQNDETGHVRLQFFNSDYPGPRFILVEGVTFDGRPVRVEMEFALNP